jgi:hypothetical protein
MCLKGTQSEVHDPRQPRPDMWAGSVKGQVEAPVAVIVRGGRLVLRWCPVLVSVSLRRAVSLIFAGWVPQDGRFGWSGSACLATSVAQVPKGAGCS